MVFKIGNKLWDNPKTKKTQYKKGHPSWLKGTKGVSVNGFKQGHVGYNPELLEEHKQKIGKSNEIAQLGQKKSEDTRVKMSKAQIKIRKNHWSWKGGITPENMRIRKSIEYRLWRESVFARDNFTCQKYEIRGGKLVAHHINNFSDFPELRFAIDNGITLSKKAHDEFHKIYGNKNNNREQLEGFLHGEVFEEQIKDKKDK